MVRDYQGALDLLDDATLAASPRAPALKISMLHHLGRLEDALQEGRRLFDSNPADKAMAGALANVAMDAEKLDLAMEYAGRAGDNADGLATLGMLELGKQDVENSLARFDRALQMAPDNPRALIGRGLSLLVRGDAASGAQEIDRGAELFRTHIGSWVAAGWGHFLAGDHAAARDRFQRAMTLDPNFSESHGGIAAIDAAEGHVEDAKRQSDVAMRLDRNCFGAALARSILLESRGHPDMARKIIQKALAVPADPNNVTLIQTLAAFGLRSGN
jgi:tetratricopeptide (TPR) repeat protein